MGTRYSATCSNCGYRFSIDEGGGFLFHLLKCDNCGEDKSISFEELGDVHLRYIKGLPGPYCIATSEQDKNIQRNYPGEPLTNNEYSEEVEKMAGKCECGGQYRFNAPPRCPECKSKRLTEDSEGDRINYD